MQSEMVATDRISPEFARIRGPALSMRIFIAA